MSRAYESPRRTPIDANPRTNPCRASHCNLCLNTVSVDRPVLSIVTPQRVAVSMPIRSRLSSSRIRSRLKSRRNFAVAMGCRFTGGSVTIVESHFSCRGQIRHSGPASPLSTRACRRFPSQGSRLRDGSRQRSRFAALVFGNVIAVGVQSERKRTAPKPFRHLHIMLTVRQRHYPNECRRSCQRESGSPTLSTRAQDIACKR